MPRSWLFNPGGHCCKAEGPTCTDLPAGMTLFLTDVNGTFEMVEKPGPEYVFCYQQEVADTVDGECILEPETAETGVGYSLYCDAATGLIHLSRFIEMAICPGGVLRPIRTNEETGEGVCIDDRLPSDSAGLWDATPDSLTVTPPWAASFSLPAVSGEGVAELFGGSVAISE